MPRNILLMTSTIAPAADTFLLSHSDPKKRLKDYVSALQFYGEALKSGLLDEIVYVDNSGFDLSALINVADGLGVRDQVEFISYRSSLQPDVSRYYLELNLLKESRSRSTKLCQKDSKIWKVTGRYLVKNINDIIKSTPDHSDIYINFRDHPTITLDFYFVGFSQKGFDAVINDDLALYNSRTSGEEILRQRIDNQVFPELKITPRFRNTPRIFGVRGHDGARYGGWKDNVKYLARSAANHILPKLWI